MSSVKRREWKTAVDQHSYCRTVIYSSRRGRQIWPQRTAANPPTYSSSSEGTTPSTISLKSASNTWRSCPSSARNMKYSPRAMLIPASSTKYFARVPRSRNDEPTQSRRSGAANVSTGGSYGCGCGLSTVILEAESQDDEIGGERPEHTLQRQHLPEADRVHRLHRRARRRR
ncbi:hypothetical protein FA95DRAFT_1277408 [Auriscalpium vulgare]|uniref:Uncharacterized protein n=1 Tax=Auriscalpium vulgare TaxID=40419 RepID=A0ACB8R366_9AGAM|nr:hypothetical protein FA95DRAFT_1277408 [Auriscalpium vulgare]